MVDRVFWNAYKHQKKHGGNYILSYILSRIDGSSKDLNRVKEDMLESFEEQKANTDLAEVIKSIAGMSWSKGFVWALINIDLLTKLRQRARANQEQLKKRKKK